MSAQLREKSAKAQAQKRPSLGDAGREASRGLSANAKLWISAGLIVHLVAVALPPMSVPPTSALQVGAVELARPYAELMGFDGHGYRFFAPNPGDSDMMRAEITGRDGQRRDVIYPDLKEQWPRLLYHRHFMLTSRLQGAPDNLLGHRLAESYARHLCLKHDAQQVRIFRRLHRLPTPEQVLQGTLLSDASLFDTPYDSPWDRWKASDPHSSAKTSFTLQVLEGGRATLDGEVLGRLAPKHWSWTYDTPQRWTFLEPGGRSFSAEVLRPHEIVVRFPQADGQELAVIARREPPPVAVYRGDAP